ncbi:MAG: hypothetical protein CM15mP42_13110 [Methanobacteriota archaeon]|nr:MAG: hypothetical protein CM15mP42_13110 [Euryarchaeota archaeon]
MVQYILFTECRTECRSAHGIPAYKQLQQAGFEIKDYLGNGVTTTLTDRAITMECQQVEVPRHYPQSVRYDWAQDLLEWFNYYLYEGNMKPALHVEMQDNMGGWRVEPTWPVNDRENCYNLPIGEGLNVVSGSGVVGPSNTLTLETRFLKMRLAFQECLHFM